MSQAVEFLYLSQEQVGQCSGLNMAETIKSVEDAFRWLEAGQCVEPHVPSLQWEGGEPRRVSIHPSYAGGDRQIAGIKWMASNPRNPSSRGLPNSIALMILTDTETGVPLVVMDGTAISAMRTGAVVGLGAMYLARPDSEVVGLIGAGVIGRTQLMALHVALPKICLVKVYNRSQEKAEVFASEMSDSLKLDIRVVSSARAAVEGADIVSPATTVGPGDEYIQAEWITEGTYLANLSGCDYTSGAILACDKVVVDNRKQLQVTDHALARMVEEGKIRPDDLVEFSTIVAGGKPGRSRSRERIFFSPFGMGIEDLANACRIYREAIRRGVGQRLELWDQPVWV